MHCSVAVQNRTPVYMNLFDHKDLGNHLLQLCPKVVKHPVYVYIYIYIYTYTYKGKVTPLQARCGQRVGRVTALLFHCRGTRREWVVSSTPRPHFTPGKDLVPILQEAEWAPGPVWTGGKSRLHQDSIPDRPGRSQSLYRLSYPVHTHTHTHIYIYMCVCVCVCVFVI